MLPAQKKQKNLKYILFKGMSFGFFVFLVYPHFFFHSLFVGYKKWLLFECVGKMLSLHIMIRFFYKA